MNDNFDLRKFLVENKSIENMNPIFRKLNENKENTTANTTTTTTTITENNLRAKIREMVLNELGGGHFDLEDLENKLGFNSGADRDPKTGNKYPSPSDQEKDDQALKGQGTNEAIDNYESMSDNELIGYAEDDGLEELIVMDGEGGLANRSEIIQALKGQGMNEDELYEAKKDKEEDLPADDAELDLDMEMEPEMDAPEDELAAAASGATGDAKELINHLMTSLDTAKAIGNEKLTTQILNTLKFAIDQSMAQ